MTFCTVTGNFTDGRAGGVSCGGGVASASFVYANSADVSGGGVVCTWGDVVDCTIVSNTAGYWGGGVEFRGGLFTRNHVMHNRAGYDGGGVYVGRHYRLTTSWIWRNSAGRNGGGVWCDYRASVRNSEIVGNVASNSGGGVYCATGRVESCTITENSAPNGGGIYCHLTGTFINVIAYANTGGDTSDGGDVGNYLHCCTIPLMAGVGNISTNPQFMSVAAGDYRLAEGSPCVDAGTNQGWMVNVGDLRHLPRIWDEVVDIGCHEQIPEPGVWLAIVLAAAMAWRCCCWPC
jgi:predicted outer membrane repeat protein